MSERQFECLGENTEKYKTFSIPTEKEVMIIDKDGSESAVTTSYKIFVALSIYWHYKIYGKFIIKSCW